jgi:pyridoxamine 5'-phosphate oxidase family protein
MFSEKEIGHLRSQRLARIATAAADSSSDESMQPDVVPIGFDFDDNYFYVGGMNILKSTKYKNVIKNNKVALVIDDLKTVDPWDPLGIRIYGTADIVSPKNGYMERTGHSEATYIRIKPEKTWSWGIEEPVFLEGKFNVKRAKRS